MSLENIIKSLEKESANEIKKIEAEFKKRADELKAVHQRRLEQAREVILGRARKEAQKKVAMRLFALKSKLKQDLLEIKREILDKVYALALEKLEKISEREYEKLLGKLIKDLPRGGMIIPAKGKEAVTRKAAKGIKVSKQGVDIPGGFMWQSDKLTIDNSWPELIAQIREKSEAEVAGKLFKN